MCPPEKTHEENLENENEAAEVDPAEVLERIDQLTEQLDALEKRVDAHAAKIADLIRVWNESE